MKSFRGFPILAVSTRYILDSGDDGKDYMTIRVEGQKDLPLANNSELANRIVNEVKSQIMVSCRVEILEYAGLPRSERKSKRIYDNRNR